MNTRACLIFFIFKENEASIRFVLIFCYGCINDLSYNEFFIRGNF